MRLGARLGLFALALQIVLSFGHVHPGDFDATNPASVAVDAGQTPPTAPGDGSDRAIDHFCPICALIQLAASALPALPPALPLPLRLAAAELPLRRLFTLAASPDTLFQARAPPSV